MQKISYARFSDLWENLDTPDHVLENYIIMEPGESAFSFNIRPNPETVYDIPRFEAGLSSLNSRSRRRRQRDFNDAINAGDTRPVLVSEGDSWFQFPRLLHDVIDHLGEDYLIWSLGAAGDTVENMIDNDTAEYMQGLHDQAHHVQAFLLSAAGNDVIGAKNGKPVLLSLLHNGTRSDRPEKLINRAELKRVTDGLRDSYRKVVHNIRSDDRFRTLPILIHGYDYAFPFPNSKNDNRRPIWVFTNRDKWLGSAFKDKGIDNPKTRRDIIRILIDALYDTLAEVADEDPNVHLIDVRGTLTHRTDWADEIHPKSPGFGRVAAKFDQVLKKVVKRNDGFETSADYGGGGGSTQPGEISTMPKAARSRIGVPEVAGETLGIPNLEMFAEGFTASTRFEAIIEEDDSVPYGFLSKGAEVGKAVARISTHGRAWDGRTGSWRGTGFLIAPNILLTNSHVINSPEVASEAEVEFGYEEGVDGELLPSTRFRLNPSRLFITSPPEDLDYCFVWVEGDPGQQFNSIQLWRGSFIAQDRYPAHIIHHPDGRPKRASLRKNDIFTGLGSREVLVHYTADTMYGSSGAPVLRDDWRLFALHHAFEDVDADLRRQMNKAGYDGDRINEGIKISAIAIDLDIRARTGPDPQSAREVLRHMGGSDSRTGYFGTLGRKPSGESAFERVVDTYRGADQDVDVAFWNIEWFNRDYDRKLSDVARVIADLNLDIWALEEVSPQATEALVAELKSKFQMEFDYLASEPTASSGRQTTTVIWNTLTVSGEHLDWPAEAHRLLKLDSRDPDAREFEAVDGKIFNRYPGLFRFTSTTSASSDPFDFLLVPLHLKAKSEGAKRRKMAANMLAKVINMAMSEFGETDVLIGGDINAELGTGQFQGLLDADFQALSAADERDGAITYLKRPYFSLIDSIFASADMSATIDSEDFMIIAADRAFPDFVTRVSDHRPVMVRLSLGDGTEAAGSDHSNTTTADTSGDDGCIRKVADSFRKDPEGTLRRILYAPE